MQQQLLYTVTTLILYIKREHKKLIRIHKTHTHTLNDQNDNNVDGKRKICVRDCLTQILFCQTFEFSIRF